MRTAGGVVLGAALGAVLLRDAPPATLPVPLPPPFFLLALFQNHPQGRAASALGALGGSGVGRAYVDPKLLPLNLILHCHL